MDFHASVYQRRHLWFGRCNLQTALFVNVARETQNTAVGDPTAHSVKEGPKAASGLFTITLYKAGSHSTPTAQSN